MQPEIPRQPIADQSWFFEFLCDQGFFRSTPDTFEKLGEGERIVAALLHRTPPSPVHTELADLLSRFGAVKREIRSQEDAK